MKKTSSNYEMSSGRPRPILTSPAALPPRALTSADPQFEVELLRSLVKEQRARIDELERENARLCAVVKSVSPRVRPHQRRREGTPPPPTPPQQLRVLAYTADALSTTDPADGRLQAVSLTPRSRSDPPLGRPSDRHGAPAHVRVERFSPHSGARPSLAADVFANAADDDSGSAVWIAHDNYPLGATMAALIAKGLCAEVVIESKRDKETVCFILGRVKYAGPVADNAFTSGALRNGERGAWCLELADCRARHINPEAERATPGSAALECLPFTTANDQPFLLRNAAQTAHFLRGCDSRVDVILSPQRFRDDGHAGAPSKSGLAVSVEDARWMPYWDSESPPRKLAPQFRSAGVGYLRLGDDMSQNGLAFVSANGSQFLSNQGWQPEETRLPSRQPAAARADARRAESRSPGEDWTSMPLRAPPKNKMK